VEELMQITDEDRRKAKQALGEVGEITAAVERVARAIAEGRLVGTLITEALAVPGVSDLTFGVRGTRLQWTAEYAGEEYGGAVEGAGLGLLALHARDTLRALHRKAS
jgi:hypothetical protein